MPCQSNHIFFINLTQHAPEDIYMANNTKINEITINDTVYVPKGSHLD